MPTCRGPWPSPGAPGLGLHQLGLLQGHLADDAAHAQRHGAALGEALVRQGQGAQEAVAHERLGAGAAGVQRALQRPAARALHLAVLQGPTETRVARSLGVDVHGGGDLPKAHGHHVLALLQGVRGHRLLHQDRALLPALRGNGIDRTCAAPHGPPTGHQGPAAPVAPTSAPPGSSAAPPWRPPPGLLGQSWRR